MRDGGGFGRSQTGNRRGWHSDSGDYEKMKALLEDKLVTGTDRSAAVTQSVKAVHKLATGAQAVIPRWLQNIGSLSRSSSRGTRSGHVGVSAAI